MITSEENVRLTRVGPGTPVGELLRRYWHPIAASGQLDEKPVRPVRLLGENFVLFKDQQGRLGLVEPRCAHRRVELKYGYVVDEGLRCPYHGWTYGVSGHCTAMPTEPEGSAFKGKVKLKSYPVQEMHGMVFAYIGPQPTPLLPWWERRPAEEKGYRHLFLFETPCNWLQIMENTTDYAHSALLHGEYYKYILETAKVPSDDPRWPLVLARSEQKQERLSWEDEAYGIRCRVLLKGQPEDHEMWKIGNPVVFPMVTCLDHGGFSLLAYRTPVDDTHTLSFFMEKYYAPRAPEQRTVPFFASPWDPRDEHGQIDLGDNQVQDNLMFVAQGEVTDRTTELLGRADIGVVKYRKLLQEQIAIAQGGGAPMNVFYDQEAMGRVRVPPPLGYYYGRGKDEAGNYRFGAATATQLTRRSPHRQEIEDLMAGRTT